jgi:hypothetical protein
MIEILVSACLLADPDQCKDVRLHVAAETVTAQQCIKLGQFEIVKWAERNPNWSIKRWSCGRPAGTASAMPSEARRSDDASQSATHARYLAMPQPGL